MGDRIKYKLNSENSQISVNTDTNIGINLIQSNKILPYGDMNRKLDVGVQFQKERNQSSKYRFITSINTLFTNVLTDISGIDSLNYFDNELFKVDGNGETLYQTLNDSIKNYLKEKNGWFGYHKPQWVTNDPCKFIDLNPKRELFDLSPKNGIKNWDIFLTYPNDIDDTHYLVNSGLPIISVGVGLFGGKQLISVTTPIKHNIIRGDEVNIDGIKYSVLRVGDDSGDNKDYTFIIDTPITNTSIGINSRVVKIHGGFECKYYIRKFKKIDISVNHDIFPIAFSKNLYNDKVYQIIFNGDIDISQYTDNLGRPLSEVYLTILKINNNGFSNIDSGINIPYIGDVGLTPNVGDIRRIHNVITWDTPTQLPIETDIDSSYDYFYGDIVEYNRVRVEETVLCDINHRFNRLNRDTNGRPEGYFYKPHNKINIRYWSTFIEQGDISVLDLPDYAEDLEDGRYLWRDYLDIGLNDGQDTVLDYPFLNGSHYIYSNININLRRQDPFNIYGLYYSESPRDIFGGKGYYDNYITKESDLGNDSC